MSACTQNKTPILCVCLNKKQFENWQKTRQDQGKYNNIATTVWFATDYVCMLGIIFTCSKIQRQNKTIILLKFLVVLTQYYHKYPISYCGTIYLIYSSLYTAHDIIYAIISL